MTKAKIRKKYEIIVIGSGIGGLTCGALLAKHGRNVLIVEKNPFAGGYVSSFQRNGFTFDRGLILSGGWHTNGHINIVLTELGFKDKIEVFQLDPLGDICSPTYKLTVLANRKKIEGQLKEQFPAESKKIEDYFTECENLLEEMTRMTSSGIFLPNKFPKIFEYSRKSLEEVVNTFFSDNRLKSVFLAHPYFLSGPDESFLIPGLLMASTFNGDIFYPKGGMQALSNLLVTALQKYNGELRLNCKADKVAVSDGKIIGIEADGERIEADYIVSDIDALQLYFTLIGEQYLNERFINILKNNVVGRSAYMVYLGVNMDLSNYTHYISYLPNDDFTKEFNPERNGIGIFIPSILDPSLAPEGKHVILIELPTPYNYGIDDNSEDQKIKKKVAQSMIQSAEKVIPGLTDYIEYKEYASPNDFERLTFNKQGSMIGWANTPSNIQKGWSNKTPVKGLFQTGHWAGPWSGVMGASKYGREIAYSILEAIGNS